MTTITGDTTKICLQRVLFAGNSLHLYLLGIAICLVINFSVMSRPSLSSFGTVTVDEPPKLSQGQVQAQSIVFSPFDTEPFHDSLCVTQPDIVQDQYCKKEFYSKCDEHEREIDAIPKNSSDDKEERCKMLWFAGFHERLSCTADGTGYKNMYSVALNSAIVNAGESLQPVLMLGRLGLKTANVTHLSRIGRWAEDRGAKVIVVPRLSFQDTVDKHYAKNSLGQRQGPWLRLEIPRLVKEHGLMDAPDICKRHVLYTDSDVMFANTLSKANIKQLANTLSSDDAMLMYGRQYRKGHSFINTGVMVIDIDKFQEEIPGMVKYLDETGKQRGFDQGLVNNYFEKNQDRLKRSSLPIHYNWKAYWKMEPSTFDQVKIIHTHGPKPGRGLKEIGLCNFTALPDIAQYNAMFMSGICCDKGRTVTWFMDSYEKLQSPFEAICDV